MYFTHELTSIALNNSRYRKNVTDLKEKKFYEIVREGGFLNFGYQVRSLFVAELLKTQQVVLYDDVLVATVRIDRPSYFHTVVRMIQGSFFSENFTLLAKEINQKNICFETINRNICMPYYPKELQMEIEVIFNKTDQK